MTPGPRATPGRAGSPRPPRPLRPGAAVALATLCLTGCRATTARPYFLPLPSASRAEVELGIPEATRLLAETMARDSIVLQNIKERDGFIDSGWLDAKTLEHTGARPLGDGVVRVRAWVGPSKEFWSEITVEAAYRVMEDPSRPDRELERALPEDHPLQRRIADVLRQLITKYGNAEELKALVAPKPAAARPDSGKGAARPDSAKAKGDTTKVKPDTTKAKPDTSSAVF